jgi:glutamyl-tRNA reductase
MLSAIGLNHKTAPLSVREPLAFAETELPAALTALGALPSVDEALLLSTCHRTEVYLISHDRAPSEMIAAVLGSLRGIAPDTFAPYLSSWRSEDAARHLLRVSAGLESMVVGEPQVLGQVRRAYSAARAAGTTGLVLNRLMQLAIASGRRVRAETALGGHGASVPHAAVSCCRAHWGKVSGRGAVIVGAGEMAALLAKAFASAGGRVVAIANRTPEHAAPLAARYGACVLGLRELTGALAGVDAILISAGAEAPLLSVADLSAHDRPLLLIDIGVPRGVDPGVVRLPAVALYDLDRLAPYTGEAPAAEDLAAAQAIVDETHEAFIRWMGSRAAVPLIAQLHRRAESIVEEELIRARGRLRGLDEHQRLAVRGVVEGALRKLLHAPFVRLRARGDDDRVLELARELFDLDSTAVKDEAS